MIEQREGHFRGEGNLELFYQSWTTSDAKGTLVITHGIAEHSECYRKTAEALVPMGWNIYAWDLRGHGRSEGKRGYVENFSFFARDLKHFVHLLKKVGKLNSPFALVGHSMGGLITLEYLVDADDHTLLPNAVALSSPALGVAVKVPAIKDLAAKVLNQILPTMTLYNELNYEDLTRDPEFLNGYDQDPLRHDRVSAPLYLGMLDVINHVKEQAGKIQIPLLIQAAGKDRLVSTPAAKEFFAHVGSEKKKILVYEDSYHEIYNDLDRNQVFKDLDHFLQSALHLG